MVRHHQRKSGKNTVPEHFEAGAFEVESRRRRTREEVKPQQLCHVSLFQYKRKSAGKVASCGYSK